MCSALWGVLVPPLHAQLSPPANGGIVALDRLLQNLAEQRRVLLIAAHPDDEDTQLLTYLSQGLGAEAAYLSLNRGEGGQNLIGQELGPQLGIIRSQELLSARQIDGATQFFTRTFDYGFSRTLEEAQRFWPGDSVLKDVVRVIRRFRPHVVVAIFSGTPSDGHGQHQDAGWVAPLAVEAAGDPSRFPELRTEEGLDPWAPLKLYRSARFGGGAGRTLTIETGQLDPRTGRSFSQIASASRSRHRSQDMGQLQRIGPGQTGLRLVMTKASPGVAAGQAEAGIFDGIPNDDPGLARLADSLRRVLAPARMSDVARPLAAVLSAGGQAVRRSDGPPAPGGTSRPSDRPTVILEQALAISSGLVMDAVASADEVVPGQRFDVDVSLYNGGPFPARLDSASFAVSVPPGWTVQPAALPPATLASGQLASRRFTLTVPDSAPPTQPYFLERPMRGAMYDWSGTPPAVRGLPFQPPPVTATTRAWVAGGLARLEREASLRIQDQAIGEVRHQVRVVPRVDVRLDPDHAVWPVAGDSVRTFTVGLTYNGAGKYQGRVRLELSQGRSPAAQSFAFDTTGQERSFAFRVSRPAGLGDGTFHVRAVAEGDNGHADDRGVVVIEYPHIRATPYVRPATSDIQVADIKLAQVRSVGYIRGASDRVPEALAQAGVPVTVLTGEDLAHGDLSKFDVVVVGSRAYETDTSLLRHNDRVLQYARNGGLVVVQYQQYAFTRGQYYALPMSIANPHDRVTDETVPVTVLDPTSRSLVRPNTISAADWEGWPQERGLYFAHDWDPAYRPVLEMHDPGMPPLEGSLLLAKYGQGTYVYTGLSFFRALPAGVPGAFKLFLNLLSLNAKDAS